MSNSGHPDERYLDLLEDVPFRPVFIIGDHRSGTTLLHRLLAETGCFNFVTAYHVIQYNEILSRHIEGTTETAQQRLMDRFQELGLKNRIIDEVPAAPDAPVEYGFILAAAFKTRRAMLTPQAHGKFLELCRKVQYISGPGKPLLLKNPWDVLNFADIKARVPTARFLFIHRHPAAVMTSQLRAIRSMLEARNAFAAMLAPWYARLYDRPLQLAAARLLDSPPVRLWVRLVGIHAVRVARYFLNHVGTLPAEEYTSIRYEDLCRQPDETMGRILQFAGVRPPAGVSWGERIQQRPPKIVPEVRDKYRGIRAKLMPYLSFHGYEAEPAWLTQP